MSSATKRTNTGNVFWFARGSSDRTVSSDPLPATCASTSNSPQCDTSMTGTNNTTCSSTNSTATHRASSSTADADAASDADTETIDQSQTQTQLILSLKLQVAELLSQNDILTHRNQQLSTQATTLLHQNDTLAQQRSSLQEGLDAAQLKIELLRRRCDQQLQELDDVKKERDEANREMYQQRMIQISAELGCSKRRLSVEGGDGGIPVLVSGNSTCNGSQAKALHQQRRRSTAATLRSSITSHTSHTSHTSGHSREIHKQSSISSLTVDDLASDRCQRSADLSASSNNNAKGKNNSTWLKRMIVGVGSTSSSSSIQDHPESSTGRRRRSSHSSHQSTTAGRRSSYSNNNNNRRSSYQSSHHQETSSSNLFSSFAKHLDDELDETEKEEIEKASRALSLGRSDSPIVYSQAKKGGDNNKQEKEKEEEEKEKTDENKRPEVAVAVPSDENETEILLKDDSMDNTDTGNSECRRESLGASFSTLKDVDLFFRNMGGDDDEDDKESEEDEDKNKEGGANSYISGNNDDHEDEGDMEDPAGSNELREATRMPSKDGTASSSSNSSTDNVVILGTDSI